MSFDSLNELSQWAQHFNKFLWILKQTIPYDNCLNPLPKHYKLSVLICSLIFCLLFISRLRCGPIFYRKPGGELRATHISRFSVVGLCTWYDNPINKQTFRIHSEYQMFARQDNQLVVQIKYSYSYIVGHDCNTSIQDQCCKCFSMTRQSTAINKKLKYLQQFCFVTHFYCWFCLFLG